MGELKQEDLDVAKLYEKGFKWMRFISFFMVMNLIFTMAIIAVDLIAPQIHETFQWVAFGIYGLNVLSFILMREVAIGIFSSSDANCIEFGLYFQCVGRDHYAHG